MAASSGIDVNRVILVVWMMGGALAALGGVLLGLSDQVQWDMGFRLLLLMFAAITLGGLGSPLGGLIGALIIGLVVATVVFRRRRAAARAAQPTSPAAPGDDVADRRS